MKKLKKIKIKKEVMPKCPFCGQDNDVKIAKQIMNGIIYECTKCHRCFFHSQQKVSTVNSTILIRPIQIPIQIPMIRNVNYKILIDNTDNVKNIINQRPTSHSLVSDNDILNTLDYKIKD